MNSKVVLSDSGTITEESSILNFKALNIRECHERPEGMEKASVIMTGLSVEKVMQSVELIDEIEVYKANKDHMINDYDVKDFSDNVVRIIYSYTDFVNKRIWKKV